MVLGWSVLVGSSTVVVVVVVMVVVPETVVPGVSWLPLARMSGFGAPLTVSPGLSGLVASRTAVVVDVVTVCEPVYVSMENCGLVPRPCLVVMMTTPFAPRAP